MRSAAGISALPAQAVAAGQGGEDVNVHYVDRVIDGRWRFGHIGVDFSADATALVIGRGGLCRLVWSKPSKFNHAPGARGMGNISYVPVSLEIREFGREAGRVTYKGSKMLFEGGRLSRERLLSVKDQIDAIFGAGTTEMIDPLKTLLKGEDEVERWLAAEEAKPPGVSPSVAALMKAMGERTDFGGFSV